MKKSEIYRRRRDAVQAYRDAYDQLVEALERVPVGITTWELRGRHGEEEKTRMLTEQVSLAAGAAGEVAQEYGAYMSVQKTGYSPTQTVNPILAWRTSLDAPWLLPPDHVLSVAMSLIGRLDAKYQEAVLRERSLAGRVAAFVRFPMDVREAVGTGTGGLRRVAVGVGILAQLFVAIVGGALAVALVGAVSALFRLIF